MASLKEAAGNGDAPDLRRAAHAINGNSRAVGAKRLADACLKIEDLADAGDLPIVAAAIEELDAEWGRVKDLLAAELAI